MIPLTNNSLQMIESPLPCMYKQILHLPAISIVHQIDTRQIIRIQSMSNYSKLFFSNGKTLVVAKLLRWFEQRLPACDFIRIHRTHLVNRDYIEEYSFADRKEVALKNGEKIGIAKRRKTEFVKHINSFTKSGN